MTLLEQASIVFVYSLPDGMACGVYSHMGEEYAFRVRSPAGYHHPDVVAYHFTAAIVKGIRAGELD